MRHGWAGVPWLLAAVAAAGVGAGVARGGDAGADPLPRRAWVGGAFEPAEGGVRVRAVLPGGSAEAGGLRAGDVVTAVGGAPVAGVPDLLRTLRPLRAGHELTLAVRREGGGEETQTLALTLKEWPREAGGERWGVDYGSVASAAGRLRTIALAPKGEGKKPAVLILQGLGMATLDNPRPDEAIDRPTGMNVYRAIAARLADAGCVVMRVDKSGCGDSEGDPAALDFPGELDGYRQALRALKARPDVDPERVFLFGHSMGGVFAPMLAGEEPVAGVAAYGTVSKTWFEYVLENGRRQHALAGGSLVDLDRGARLMARFHHAYLFEKQAPSAIFRAAPELEAVRPSVGLDPGGATVFGRNPVFFQQLHEVNLPGAWDGCDARVLALWGEADYVSGRDDHEAIAAVANARRAGRGRFQVVAASDHGFDRFATMAEAMAAAAAPSPPPGAPAASRFNPEIGAILAAWVAEPTAAAPQG